MGHSYCTYRRAEPSDCTYRSAQGKVETGTDWLDRFRDGKDTARTDSTGWNKDKKVQAEFAGTVCRRAMHWRLPTRYVYKSGQQLMGRKEHLLQVWTWYFCQKGHTTT